FSSTRPRAVTASSEKDPIQGGCSLPPKLPGPLFAQLASAIFRSTVAMEEASHLDTGSWAVFDAGRNADRCSARASRIELATY
ncbi:MAG: hypothetical protein WCQ45_02310, partial [bacterium]